MDGSVDWIELKIPVQGVKGRRLLFCLPVFFFALSRMMLLRYGSKYVMMGLFVSFEYTYVCIRTC